MQWTNRVIQFWLLILTSIFLGCRTNPVLVPIARVHYDGFREGDEIIATLKKHGISAAWESEGTVVFPILVSKTEFGNAVVILQTNSLVTSGKVRLYPNITREVK
jgi:type III secretory pathway lipoprotein EscJ